MTDRIYITLGMSAFILLLPLAITSFNRCQRWLGARRWQGLHRLVYPLAILAVLHHGFMVKGFQLAPGSMAAFSPPCWPIGWWG